MFGITFNNEINIHGQGENFIKMFNISILR